MKTSKPQPARPGRHSFECSETVADLSRSLLPWGAAERAQMESRQLVWTFSIAVFFLTIGIVGAKYPPLRRPILPAIKPAMAEPTMLTPSESNPPPEDEAITPIADQEPALPAPPDLPTGPDRAGDFQIPGVISLSETAVNQTPSPNPNAEPRTTGRPVRTLSTGDAEGRYPKPPYPAQMINRGLQGKVVIEITVNALGQKQAVSVKESSGYPELDEHARQWVQHRWTRFPNATELRTYQAPLIFRIDPVESRSAKSKP